MIGKVIAMIIGSILSLIATMMIFTEISDKSENSDKKAGCSMGIICIILYIIGGALLGWSGYFDLPSVDDAFMRRP